MNRLMDRRVTGGRLTSRRVLAAGLALVVLALLAAMAASVMLGVRMFGFGQVWQAYSRFDGSNGHLIITTSRVPRTLLAAAVGASLAVAGAVMQAVTRNDLASPSVLGINAGASLCAVAALVWLGPSLTMNGMIRFALGGAAASAAVVYALGLTGGNRLEPARLTIAGSTIAAFAASLTSGLILLNNQSLDDALFWMLGSVSGRKLEHLEQVFPYMAAGWLLAGLIAESLNVLTLGEDNARGLGLRLRLVQAIAALSVILLAGSSVAAAGPIAFVGLMVPHLCRFFTGPDHRWLLPWCAAAGALLLVAADLLSRFVLMPKEVPVGITTALIGVPFLIYVARRRKHARTGIV
ncbi:iron ABC transporter permease [Paenibacillus sp. YN15]|uniref:FecCD family ABC transporter permease n=1 Tax=Paenibacillus sp. YN15 TaxID=1742774 RepID=UPI00215CB48C|nr:iron ABC transporter permease [Paenibacillus sp. YN15]